ncbi:hypothetical protein HYH02_005069 [Chlamydomonas schloesseri]|uniref:SBP-type domain-containing protein n=1 Tax=Chlamydomonas schloesseri TaxID=2026947 RepID=A0A835WMK7_9CHLO|nr:hypothetical protein HYH02_005069 [Chlamydomonas schloesseri]|eukprot:KAG2450568.1 hypothetical protein HYH02_005069 [Chlamydomonas schloesseri]
MSGRARKRVEDEAEAEEAWTLDDFAWDPQQCVARKRTKTTPGSSAQAVFGTHAYLEGAGEAAMLAAGSQLLQQQLAGVPVLEPLPELQTVNPEEADPATHCEVTGCGLCLEGLKRYYIRMRVCEKHLHAPAVLVNGTISRFCQQCGKWQAVAEFEGSKKSCIATLERHNARHRAKVQARLAEQQSRGGTAAEKAAAKTAAAKSAAKRRGGSAATKGRGAAAAAAAAAPSTSGASGGSAAGNSDNARSSFGMAELMGTAASAFAVGGPIPYPPAMDGSGAAASLLQPFGAWDAARGASGAVAGDANGGPNSGGALPMRPPITTGLAAADAASAGNGNGSGSGMGLAGSGRLASMEVTGGGFARLPSVQAPPPQQLQEQHQLLLPMLMSQEGLEAAAPPHAAFRRSSSVGMPQLLQPPPPPEDVRMALGAVPPQLLSQAPAWRQGYAMGGPAAGPFDNGGSAMRGFGGASSRGGYAPGYLGRAGSGMQGGPVFGGPQHGYGQPHEGHVSHSSSGYQQQQQQAEAGGFHLQHRYQQQMQQQQQQQMQQQQQQQMQQQQQQQQMYPQYPHHQLLYGAGQMQQRQQPYPHQQYPNQPHMQYQPAQYQQAQYQQARYQQAPYPGSDHGFIAAAGSRGSTPGAATGEATPATAAAAAATPHASSGSDTSGIHSQATARQAMAAAAAAITTAAASGGGVPQPRGSSGTAASGASGNAFANSTGAGGDAAAAAAPGAGAGGAGAAAMPDSGVLAARLNNVMAELSTLVAQVQHLQQPVSGGSPPPPAVALTAPASALPIRNDSAPAEVPLPLPLPLPLAADAGAAGAAAGHSPRSVSAQSAPTRPGSDAVTSSARAGSNPLSPIMDAALNMMAQVSELAAALQPGADGGAAAVPRPAPGFPPSPWAVTTGMPVPRQGQMPPPQQQQQQQQQVLQQPGGGSGGWSGGQRQQQQQQQPTAPEMAASSPAIKPFPAEFSAAGPAFVVSTGYPGSGSGGGSAAAGPSGAHQQQSWIPPPPIDGPCPMPNAAGRGQPQAGRPDPAGGNAATPYSSASHADSPATTVDGSAAPSPMHPPAVPQQSGGVAAAAAADVRPGPDNAAAAAFGPDADGDDLDEQLLGELFEYLEEDNGPAAAATANGNGNSHATIAVAAQQAVGNYQQTMAAQPYPLPAASLAPPAAAAGGVAQSPPISEDEVDEREFTRVSLKAMNVLPHELPPNLRASLRRWLRESRAEALQATLRPGCLQLVVDVARPLRTPSGAPVAGDLASVLIPPHDADQAAADVFRILGQRLRDTYVQVDRQVLQIRVGERPIVLSWEQAAEDGGLDNARFPELFTCSAPAVCAGAEVALELTGKHLCHPSTKAFARLRGHDLPALRLPNPAPAAPVPAPASSEPSTSIAAAAAEADSKAPSPGADPATSSGSLLRVRMQLPAGAVGLMVVEAGVGHLLGGWWPVLVLPAGRDAAAAELGELSAQAQQQEAAPAGGAAKRGFERLVRDLASVLEMHADVCASASPSSSASSSAPATVSPAEAGAAASSSSPRAGSAATAAGPASGPGAAVRSSSTRTRSSGDGTTDASTTAASAAGWSRYTSDTLTGTTGAGSTMASTLLTTTTTTGPRGGAPHLGGAHGAPGAGGAPAAAGAAADTTARLSSPTHSGDGAAAAPARAAPVADPTADGVRKALARCARLLRYTIARGRPHLTALLLEAAHGLAAFPGALPAAAAAQPAGAFMAAGIDLQALLPLAVLSGSVATVDAMVGFAAAVLRAPLRLDLPYGPAGLSALHLSALLRDGGAMAGHLVSSQPWAAWSWLCLGWQPPSEQAAAPATAAGAGAGGDVGTSAQQEAQEADRAEEEEEESKVAEEGTQEVQEQEEVGGEGEQEDEEEDDLRAPVPLPTKLTPGALCVLLGQAAPLQRAVALVQAAQQQQQLASGAGVGAAGGGSEGDVTAALVGAVQAWGRTGAALLAALCDQLARQRL